MYVNFAHFFIPKLCALVSLIINPFTIYIVWSDKKLQLGNYRYLLVFFAIFNLTASLVDVLVPWSILNHRYAFSVFVVDGYFLSHTEFHQAVFVFRCGFISGTYAILHAHYLYRFLVIFNSHFLTQYFVPYGLVAVVAYTLFHIGYWVVACWCFLAADYSRRQYVRDSLLEELGLDSMNITILVAQYSEGSNDAIIKTRIGIGALSLFSTFSIAVIFILGYKIIKKLRSQNLEMSELTKKLQTQLMKALIAQAAIPTFVSFSPCIITWYQPIFNFDMGRWLQHTASIAVVTFPSLDPIALIVFVPKFRQKFYKTIMLLLPKRNNRTSQSAVSTTQH